MKLVRHLLFIINCVFAALLLLSTLAGDVEPHRLVVLSLLSYAFVPLLIVNVIFVVVWVVMGKLQLLLSVGVIVLRWSFVTLFFQVGGHSVPAPSAEGNLLKVMTFNVRCFVGNDGDMSYQDAASGFTALVRDEMPDVISLQEVVLSPSRYNFVDTLSRLGYRYCYPSGRNAIGTLMFSRHPIIAKGEISKGSRYYVDINKNGARVRVVGVHLASYHFNDDDLQTVDNATHGQVDSSAISVVGKLVNAIKAHEKEWHNELQPVVEEWQDNLILMGDFNDTPASYVYHQATKHLSDAYCEQGSGFITTYHGAFPAFRIDHILHTPQTTCLAYKRLRADLSDHYPVVAVFRLAE